MIKGRFNFIIVGAIAATLSFLSPVDVASSKTLLTREQVLEDAKSTENFLKKYHPNLYAHRTPKQIRSIWNKAKSQLPDSPGFVDAATLIQRILAAVCDEHTSVTLNKAGITRLFPYGLVILKDKLYLDNFKFSGQPMEVVAINQRNSAEIIKFLKSIASLDGCQKSDILYSRHIDNQKIGSILLTNFLGAGSSFNVKFRDPETGTTTSPNFRAVSLSVLSRRSRTELIQGRRLPLKSLGVETNERDWEFATDNARQILVRSNPEKSLFYIYFPSFYGGKPQAEAIDKEMRALVAANPDHVIVDLTDNPGGLFVNAQQFMSYFLRTSSQLATIMRSRIRRNISGTKYVWNNKDRRKFYNDAIKQFKKGRKRGGQYQLRGASRSFGNKSYRGNLTLLVSPQTGSAATFVATFLKRKGGAKIVGDIGDVSMKTSCGGAPGVQTLPNTEIGILVPLICGDRHRDARRKGNLHRPDIPVDIARHSSRKINAAILKAAIEALDLKKVADSGKFVKPAESPVGPSLEQAQGFAISRKTFPVTIPAHASNEGPAWIGVGVVNITGLNTGAPELDNRPSVLIVNVLAGSPAEKIGLQAGDFVLSVDGKEIHDVETAIETVSKLRQGQRTEVKILKLADTTTDLISILHGRLADAENRKVSAFILGSLYASGNYGLTNRKYSIRLLNIASDAGSAEAAAFLGNYYTGDRRYLPLIVGKLVVERNYDQAMKYFSRAAALGDTNIMFRLARIYDDNKRGNANPELAARYLLHAYHGRNKQARNALFEKQYMLSNDARIALKRLLRDAGVYDGKLDGSIDFGSRQALARLQTRKMTLPKLPDVMAYYAWAADFGDPKLMKEYTRAAAQGDAKTMFRLAQIYDYNKRYSADPELAARYLLHSYQGRNRLARDTLFEAPYIWSKDTRIALKRHLHDAGIYNGELDREIDAASRMSIVLLKTGNIRLPELPREFPSQD